jgi:DNA polymerase phi
MKESSAADSEGSQGNNPKFSGVWSSKLHFAWDAVIRQLADVSAKHSSRLSFADFWTEVVDSKFFGAF